MPCRPFPGSICVAPASASAATTAVEVVPGALISMPLRPARASASAARSSVARFGVGRTLRVSGSKSSAGNVVMPAKRPPSQRVEPVGDGGDLAGREAALVAAVEGVALGLDAGEQRLHVAGGGGRGGRLAGLRPR